MANSDRCTFPRTCCHTSCRCDDETHPCAGQRGATKRELAAMLVLAGAMASRPPTQRDPATDAAAALAYADALMAAL